LQPRSWTKTQKREKSRDKQFDEPSSARNEASEAGN